MISLSIYIYILVYKYNNNLYERISDFRIHIIYYIYFIENFKMKFICYDDIKNIRYIT